MEVWKPLSQLKFRESNPQKRMAALTKEELETLKLRSPTARITAIRAQEQAERERLEALRNEEFHKLQPVREEVQRWNVELAELKAAGINTPHILGKARQHENTLKELRKQWQDGEI